MRRREEEKEEKKKRKERKEGKEGKEGEEGEKGEKGEEVKGQWERVYDQGSWIKLLKGGREALVIMKRIEERKRGV